MTRTILLALALALPLSACDPGEQTPPIDDDTTDDEPPPIDLTEALGPDEARAGELTADHVGAFIGGAAGECGPGDFLMYNDRARFAIQGIREGDNYLRTPGSIIDVDVVRPTGQADRDAVDDVTALLGTSRLFHAETVEVVADGLDGGPAIIRALGSDGPFTFIEGAIESPGFFPDLHLEVEQTYTLEPGSPLLQVRTRVTNGDDEQRDITFLDGGFVDLGTMESFVPGVGVGDGFPTDGSSARVELSLRDDQAFAIFPAEGALADPGVLGDIFDSLGLMIAMGPDVEIPVGGQAEYTRYVGVAADLATLEAARRSLQSLATAKVVGTLTAADSGDPIPGARVFLTDPEGAPWTIAITGDDGGFELVGPPGEAQVVAVGDGINEQMDLPLARGAYGSHAHASANELALAAFAAPGAAVAVPQADGFGRSERIDVTLADGEAETVDLTLPDPAVLTLRTADPDGTPLPAMAWILPVGDGHQGADSRLGERRPGGARKVVWLVDGELDVPLPAGTYDLVGHRGLRYETDSVDGLELVGGGTTTVELTLALAVETPGQLSADFHVHSSPSPDGKCSMEERIASVVANDLQVHVATDHDQIADYRPLVEAMGVSDWMTSVPGEEGSTVLRGHFNLYPAVPDPAASNNGAPIWWEMEPADTGELFERFREVFADEGFIQVNHGRGPGMFSLGGYDPEEGTASSPDVYNSGFDSMEILNGKDYGDAAELREDWCSHLDRGLRPIAIGVSDVHGRRTGPGYARTYVDAGIDDPAEFDPDTFFAALRAGKAVVSGGPFVTLTASSESDGPVGLGETLVGETITLSMEVQGPSWMSIDEIWVYGEGCDVLEVLAVDPEAAETPILFQGETTFYPAVDTFYFIEVHGSATMGYVWSGAHAYALTNPIFVDVP